MDNAAIELVDVSRRFGEILALDGISLSIRRGEFFSLLGPSGCGKTTLLRLIAGLDLPDSGFLRISGQEATSVPAHKRPVNTVFQSYALFPHLNVWENVAFGLRMKKTPVSELKERVNRVMETVQISELASRKPGQLSGGQKQRVALARAIVNEPDVLLLDEPLGALDLKLRKQLQVELHALQRRLGITFIYVTHDQEEALTMSDRIAVINTGKVEQLGNAEDVYEFPRTRFVAQFIGSCNLLEGNIVAQTRTAARVQTSYGELELQTNGTQPQFRASQRCTLAVRPEKIQLSAVPLSLPNCLALRIADLVYTGSETQYLLNGANGTLKAWILNTRVGHQGFQIGQEVTAHIPPGGLVVLED